MKKTIAIANYLDTFNMFGNRQIVYVNTVWGATIDFDGSRWHLRDKTGKVVSVGNIAELHGDGQDYYDYKLKNIVSY